MEVIHNCQTAEVSLRKQKQIFGDIKTRGTNKRKLEANVSIHQRKKMCTVMEPIFSPQSPWPNTTDLERKIGNTACRPFAKPFRENVKSPEISLAPEGINNVDPLLKDIEDISLKMESLHLNDSSFLHEKRIENALLLFTKKRKMMIKQQGVASYKIEDVQEFCTGMIDDMEQWLREKYEHSLEVGLREQYSRYIAFKNDNLLNEDIRVFAPKTAEETEMSDMDRPDYLN